ncbi:Response regulator receiver domain-containing protein [Chitinophaga sp. CF118]|uniref:response regulator n=1 Tax=Chitinophaga sp. CF118 TaxID=1884367 RepID=UPI0008F08A02|nr:response regulator [Chitinophaga sp. CF118]SFD77604.1 Response regulator receiver domain-containing protein [Chitinophaga sp. CF118]
MKKLNSILLVEDDEITNYINQMVIKKLDCAEHVQVAWNGADALAYLKQCGEHACQQPELILLDINMPGLNGWEFLDEYSKLDDEERCKVVVVMLTTSLNPDDKKRATDNPVIAGFRSKPLTTAVLEEILSQYFIRG